MKLSAAVVMVCLVGFASPAHAQFGSLGDKLKKAQEAKGKVDTKVAEIRISDADERKLGEEVSARLRQDFGVYQDKDVTTYVSLVGKVAGKTSGDGHDTALRFRLRDRDGSTSVPVVYRGSVPDLFRTGREVVVDGTLRDGTFVAERNSLVTKCPSKYVPAKKSTR